jgi:hypothetical protein
MYKSFVLSVCRSTDGWFFGLPIIYWIEFPTAVVTTRLYSNLGIDFASDLHQPRDKVGHDVRGFPCDVAAGSSRLHGLHRWPVFTVIARDFTENVAIDFDLHAVVHAMAHTAPPSV